MTTMETYVSKSKLILKSKSKIVKSAENKNRGNILTDRSNQYLAATRERRGDPLMKSGTIESCKVVISTNNDYNCKMKPNTKLTDNIKGKSFHTQPVSKHHHVIGLKLNRNTSGIVDLSVGKSKTPETDLVLKRETCDRNGGCDRKKNRRSLIPRADIRCSLSPRTGQIYEEKLFPQCQNRQIDFAGNLKNNGQVVNHDCLSEELAETKVKPLKISKSDGNNKSVDPDNTSSDLKKIPSVIKHDISREHIDGSIQTVGRNKQDIVSNLDIINVTQYVGKGKLPCEMQTDAHCISRPITLKSEEKNRAVGSTGDISKKHSAKPSLLPLIKTKQSLNLLLNEKSLVRKEQGLKKGQDVKVSNPEKSYVTKVASKVASRYPYGQGNYTDNGNKLLLDFNTVSDVCKQSKVIKFMSSGSLPSQQVLNSQDNIFRNIGQKYVKFGNICKQNVQETRCALIKSQVRLPVQSIKAYDPKNTETDWKTIDKVALQSELRPFNTGTVNERHIPAINSKTITENGLINDLDSGIGVSSEDSSVNRGSSIKKDKTTLDEHSLGVYGKTLAANGKGLITNVQCDCQNCEVVTQQSDVLDKTEGKTPGESADVLKYFYNSSYISERPGRLNDISYTTSNSISDNISTNQDSNLTNTSNSFVSTQCVEDLIYGPQREYHLNTGTDNVLNNLHASHCNKANKIYLTDRSDNNRTTKFDRKKGEKGCHIINSLIKCNNYSGVYSSTENINGNYPIYKEAETKLNAKYPDFKSKDSYSDYIENSNETSYTMHKRPQQSHEFNPTGNTNIRQDLSRKSSACAGRYLSSKVKVVKPSGNDRVTAIRNADRTRQDKLEKVDINRISSASCKDHRTDSKVGIIQYSVKQSRSKVNDKTVNVQKCETAACKNKKVNLDLKCNNARQNVRPKTIEGISKSRKVNSSISDVSNRHATGVKRRYNDTSTSLQINNVNNKSRVLARGNSVFNSELTDLGHNTAIGEEKDNCEIAKDVSSAYLETKSNSPITFTEEFKSGNIELDQCEVQRSETSLVGNVLSSRENESVKVTNRNNLDPCCLTAKDGALSPDNDLCKELPSKLFSSEFNFGASCKENTVLLSEVSDNSICDVNSKNKNIIGSEILCLSLPSGESDQSYHNDCENPISSGSLGYITTVRKQFFETENENSSEIKNYKSLRDISIQDVSNYDVFINDCNTRNEAVITSDKEDNWRKAMDLRLPSATIDDYCDFKGKDGIESENIEKKASNIAPNEHLHAGYEVTFTQHGCNQSLSEDVNYPNSYNNSSVGNCDTYLLPKSELDSRDKVIPSELQVKGYETTIFIQEPTLNSSESHNIKLTTDSLQEQDVTTKSNISESKPGEINILSSACSDTTDNRKALQHTNVDVSADNRLKSDKVTCKTLKNKKATKVDGFNKSKSTSFLKSRSVSPVSKVSQVEGKEKFGNTSKTLLPKARSVSPVCKKSALLNSINVTNRCDTITCVSSYNSSRHAINNVRNGTKHSSVKDTNISDSKNASMPSSTRVLPQADKSKSKIPSASKLKGITNSESEKRPPIKDHYNKGTLKYNLMTSKKSSTNDLNKNETRKKSEKSPLPVCPQPSGPSSKESSPISTDLRFSATSREKVKRNDNAESKTVRKKSTGNSTSSKERVKTQSRDISEIALTKSRSDLLTNPTAGQKQVTASPKPANRKIRKTLQTEKIKDNKTLRNNEKLLHSQNEPRGMSVNKNEKVQQHSMMNGAISDGKNRVADRSNSVATSCKSGGKSAIPTLSKTSARVNNIGKNTDKAMTKAVTSVFARESSGSNGTKVLSLTKKNVQRLGQMNKKIETLSDMETSNPSSPALSRKSSSGINESKMISKRSSISSKCSVKNTSQESSPALSRKSRSTTPGIGKGAKSAKTTSSSRPSIDIKYNTSGSASRRSPVSSVGKLPSSNANKKLPSATSGEINAIKQPVKPTKNDNTSSTVNNGKTSNKLARQPSTSNVNSVNRLASPKIKRVSSISSVQKRESLEKQTKENAMRLPRTSTPTVNKFKSSVSENLQKLKSKQPIMKDPKNPENAQISENPTFSSAKSSILSESDNLDDKQNDRMKLKTLPEERLPSMMPICRCETSGADSIKSDEKSKLVMKSPATDNLDSASLFEIVDKEKLEVMSIFTDDNDINKHSNEQLVDIEDKFKADDFSNNTDAEDISVFQINERDSTSDLEEYWSLSEEDNDKTITDSPLKREMHGNKFDKKDKQYFDLQNNSDYPLSDVCNTSNTVKSIPEDVQNQLENMKIETRHVHQLHYGESGEYLEQVADDVKTICKIEEITDDICIPAQMEDFIPQNTYLDQQSDNNKYTFDLQEENITHMPKSDPYSEGLLVNSSERFKNCDIDKKQYEAEDYEEKLPLNTILGECGDEITDNSKIEVSVDWKGVSKPKHMKDLCDEQADEGLEKTVDKMSHLSFTNIIPHQNSLDYVSSESKTTLELQVSSGLLTVKRELATGVDEIVNENFYISDSFSNSTEQSKNQNNDHVCEDCENHFDKKSEINSESCTKFVPEDNGDGQELNISERRLSGVDSKCFDCSQVDSVVIQYLDEPDGINIEGDIPDLLPENGDNENVLTQTKTAFMEQDCVPESAKTVDDSDLNVSNSQIQLGSLHDEDNTLHNIKYDTDSDFKNVRNFDLDGTNCGELYQKICDCDQSDIEMEHKTVLDTFPGKTCVQNDTSSGTMIIRRCQDVKCETVVLTTNKHSGGIFNKISDLKSVESTDVLDNQQNFNTISDVTSRQFESEEYNCVTESELSVINKSCKEHTERRIDTINKSCEETDESKCAEGTLAIQQVNDNEDNEHRTDDNELSIDSPENFNLKPKQGGPLQVCNNEEKLSETGLSNHLSQDHSTNKSTNRIAVITTDSETDKSVNAEIPENKPIQSKSEIPGFDSGSENIEENNCNVSTEIKVINPCLSPEQTIESMNVCDKVTNTNALCIKDDLCIPAISYCDKTDENQSLQTSDSNNLDNGATIDNNVKNSNKSYHMGIPSVSCTPDNNDVLQTTNSDSESIFVNSDNCFNTVQVTSMAILKTRLSVDEHSNSDQTDEIKINDTSSEQDADFCVTFEAQLSRNENTDNLEDKCSEAENETFDENNEKSITDQEPLQDQRKLNDFNNSEISVTISLTKAGDNESQGLRTLELHNEIIQTDQIAFKDKVFIRSDKETDKKSISNSSEEFKKSETVRNDNLDTDFSNETIFRENSSFKAEICYLEENETINQQNSCANGSDATNFETEKGAPITFDHDSKNNVVGEKKVPKTKSLSRRDTGRNSFRRHTTNVCLSDTTQSENNISVPVKQRARSKSPVGRISQKDTEIKRPMPSCFGSGRVSEICKAFIKKACKGTIVTSPERPLSPEPQVTSPAKKLKWVKDCGTWKRVPVETGDFSTQITDIHPSETSTCANDFDEENTKTDIKVNVKDIANKWQLYKRPCANEKEQDKPRESFRKNEVNRSKLIQLTDNSAPLSQLHDENKAKEIAKGQVPRVPPKPLPKPVISKLAKASLDCGFSDINGPTVLDFNVADDRREIGHSLKKDHKEIKMPFPTENHEQAFEETVKEHGEKGVQIPVGSQVAEEHFHNDTIESENRIEVSIMAVEKHKTDRSESELVLNEMSMRDDTCVETSTRVSQQLFDKKDITMHEKLNESGKFSENNSSLNKSSETSSRTEFQETNVSGTATEMSGNACDIVSEQVPKLITESNETERKILSNTKIVDINDEQSGLSDKPSTLLREEKTVEDYSENNRRNKDGSLSMNTDNLPDCGASVLNVSEGSIEEGTNDETRSLKSNNVLRNRNLNRDNKFGLTKSLMTPKPYVQTDLETNDNGLLVLDSGKSQNDTINSSNEDVSATKGSQKLKAIRIKQEMFPKEDEGPVNSDKLKPFSDETRHKMQKDSVQWISPIKEALYQLKQQENVDEGKNDADVHFYISDEDLPRGYDERSGYSLTSVHGSSIDSGLGSSVINRPYGDYQFPHHSVKPGKYIYSGALVQREVDKPMLANVDYKNDAGEAMYYPRSPGTIQKQLLSEILELEENINEENSNSFKEHNDEESDSEPCSTPTSTKDYNSDIEKKYNEYGRSNSLPSCALSRYYEDSQFIIDSDYERYDGLSKENSVNLGDDLVQEKSFKDDKSFYDKVEPVRFHKKDHTKISKHKSDSELEYFDDEADVFADNDGNITIIDTDESISSIKIDSMVQKRTPKAESDSKIPRPLSIDENQLESFMSNSSEKIEVKKSQKNIGMKNRRSASFKDISERRPKIKVKRNSSFKEAQEKGSLHNYNSDAVTPDFLNKDELRPKSPGFLQRLWSKRKSVSDKNSSTKQTDSSKVSGERKVSLRNLFMGKKGKGSNNSSRTSSFSSEPGTPGTPPIAAFQNDMDIHIIESAPNSPFSGRQFRRRHTSADIYTQNNKGMCQSTTDVSTYRGERLKSDDQISVQSLVINSGMEQPLRPKSPKPTGVTITRRNSSLSLHSSPHKDVIFEIGGQGDTDSISICSVTSSNIDNVTSVPFDLSSSRKQSKNQLGLQHDKGFSDLVQGEMTSSNSNDSGIQHDVSAHSSNESLKTSQDSTSSVIRRKKSPSPRPERPKSEISVRWADLVETTEITPVKRRDGSQSFKNKPRPISDLDDNIEFFDEMYGEVFDDIDTITGGSSLNSDMKSFGSQISLQPYSSLQNLDQLKRQDSLDSKPCKRRMSTPHPIKSRQKQAAPKQKKHHTSPLVRSHSMPESLDKLHKKKKLYMTLGSSNLHGDGLLHNNDDDSSSDDGSDIFMDRMSLHEKSLSARSSNIQLATLDEISEVDNLIFAEALWDHITMDPEELGFRAGDVIEVMDNSNKDWWWGAVDDKDGEREGWFPATFVRLRVNQQQIEEELVTRLQEVSTEHKSPKLRRISMINQDQARENVVNEIIHAEREYVKHLKDVVEGYVRHARKRTDMFSEERISVLFGNIEDIYDFSNRFLESLESAFNEDHPHLSELGQCFLEHSKEFEIYSDYCNNHPSASEELKESYRKQKYRHFFEACRLLQEMIEIPLEGFLLTPVQKICKYPLQLAELLKYTSTNHPDFGCVQAALESMKKIAALINERKRKMESIEKLASWQQTVEDWQGSDLLEKSSELIMSGEAHKINSAGWSQERFFFLFDHQLIYCKKDLLKRNGYSYKGRIDMDQCDIYPIEDGKDVQYNVTVKNAWKLHETVRDKWYLLFAKTPSEKQKWLKAYNTERQRVREDQENNFVPVYWKRNILNKLKANKAKHGTSRNTVPIDYQREFIRGMPSHATLPRSFGKKQQEKKKGWFIFGKQKSK